MNKEEIESLIEHNPELRATREKLEAMANGAYCMHRTWGFGEIKGYDAGKNRLIIDFTEAGKMGHEMAPAFCIDKLEILPQNHILVRNRKEPRLVESLVKSNPVQLVKEILVAAPNHKMTTTEIEVVLIRLLGSTKMKKWWVATKKLLLKDPFVGVPAKKEGQYELRDEEDKVSPEREILEEYNLNKNPKKKIQLAEKLFQFSSIKDADELPKGDPNQPQPLHNYKATDPEIAAELENVFNELTEAIKSAKRLTKAECLYGLWVRNDLCRFFKGDVDSLEPTSKSIILSCNPEELSKLSEEIPQNPACLKRLLDLLARVYAEGEEWVKVITGLLERSTGKFTAECINFLIERGQEKHLANVLSDWLDSQNLKSPVLIWIVKNRDSRKYEKIVKPLLSHDLLSAILYAIDREAVLSTSSRRIQLAEVLSEDYGLIADLLENANEEIARDLAQALNLNQGFEPLTKKSLLARFIKIYPRIQSLLSDDEDAPEASGGLVVSQWSLEERRAELEELIKVKIPENKEAINIAKEHGDLKENSEYKMARQDQETLMARKSSLENELSRAQATDFSDTPSDKVGVGSIVVLKSASGKKESYTILGAWDSDPEKNILSYKTPLAQKLVGKSVGDEFNNNGDSWEIIELARWVDKEK